MGGNFGLAPLLGKPLAIVSDARLSGRNSQVVVERLLAISGEDAITVDRKYRDQWTGKLPCRFVIVSNELPQLGDASAAIANRFVPLVLGRSWLGNEDRSLEGDLRRELPGILTWALDGLERLHEQGRFTSPPSAEEALATLIDLASPVGAFLRESLRAAGRCSSRCRRPLGRLEGAGATAPGSRRERRRCSVATCAPRSRRSANRDPLTRTATSATSMSASA